MREGLRVGGTVLVAVLVAVLAAPWCRAEDQTFTPIPVIKGVKTLATGSDAPVFTVKDLDGKVYDAAQERQKRAQVMVFWSIFCEPCREEMPVIEKLANEYKAGGKVDLVAVNMDGAPFLDSIKGFVKQYKYSLRVVLDELDAKGDTFAIADPYQVAGTPMLYLVNTAGKIAGSHVGRISEADLRVLINGMLEAK